MNTFKIKGVVEGFYGRPWTWEERKDIISFMGQEGYNLYIYAPKADLLHRDKWRNMYDSEFEQRFKELIEAGNRSDVEVSMAVSPGLSLVYSDEHDLQILKEKFLRFTTMGTRTISLFLDDIPEKLIHESDKSNYQSLAHAQADFTNRLFETLTHEVEGLQFILCPTIYHGEQVTDYHYTLGEKLNDQIRIMWTGPQVCSEKLTVENAKMTEKAFRRKPLYWDNFPVNDASMVPELHIGRFSGRDGQLEQFSEGFVVNPMNQAYASMPVLKNIGFYLNDPEQYDPDRAIINTFKEMYPEIAQEFLLFSKACDASPLKPGDPEITIHMIKKLEEFKKKGTLSLMAEFLNKTGQQVCAAHDKIAGHIDDQLKIDIIPWLAEFNYYGQLMQDMAQALVEIELVYRDEHPPSQKIEDIHRANTQLETALEKLAHLKTRVFGKGIREFALDLLITCKGLVQLVDW
ncbi:MAG: protein O-GlcNAcase [Thermotogota bacterium]|nr:protein O-GlcNAcase [Thermotogota bacterium]